MTDSSSGNAAVVPFCSPLEDEVDRHGVQVKSEKVPALVAKAVVVLCTVWVCLSISFRQRSTLLLQAAMAAGGLVISAPFIKLALGNLTLALEIRRRNRGERLSWKLCEKRIYSGARLYSTKGGRQDEQNPRRLCVVEHNKDEETSRDKPTLLFVHGSMAQLSQFDRQIAHFRKLGYHIVAYDYYGCGRSPKPPVAPSEYSPSAHLHDLMSVYGDFCASRTSGPGTVIIGHSFGCSQVLRLVQSLEVTHKFQQPKGVVLMGPIIDSTGQNPDAAKVANAQREKLRKIFGLPLGILRIIQPLLSKGFAQRALHPQTLNLTTEQPDLKKVHTKLLKYLRNCNGRTPMHVASSFYLQIEFIKEEVLKSRGVPSIPALLMTGDADKLTPEQQAKTLLKAWKNKDASFVSIPNAGHQIMQEQPFIVNQRLELFVGQLFRSSST